MDKDEKFMEEAIKEAKIASLEGCSPFGAVLVKNGKIKFRAHNTSRKDNDPTAHSEVALIRKACKELKTKSLKGYTLYATAKPCAMCMSACVLAEVETVIYGVPISDFLKIKREWGLLMTSEAWEKIKIKGGILKRKCLRLYSKIK